jgi:hypothetical protein
MSISLRRPIAAFVGVMSLAGAATIATSPAHSVPAPADAQCPQTYPLADLTKGQSVDGFTGTILGTIKDGIAPGLDMIVARLTSPEIDRVGGIWEGMSGSPVYAADGRLIGAVSYGLAFGSSPVAGITPADDMLALLTTSPTPQARPAQRVSLPATLRARVLASGATTTREATSGLERLAVPVGVSGVTGPRLKKLSGRIDLGNIRLYRSAPAAAAPVAAPGSEIFAGSNLAASLSYGDLSAVGTGTTTMVCNGTVVGFGHPFNFSGDTSMTLHGADVIYVQEDPLGAPFKVSNPTGPVGVIDEDRMAGIKGELGAAPTGTLLRTVVTGPHGRSRTGDTRVTVPDFASTATLFGFLANLDRVFDHVGKGSADVNLTVTGRTDAGARFSLTRSNRFVDSADATFASVFEAANDVDAVIGNDFTGVTLGQIRIDARLSDQVRALKVAKVQVRRAGVWHTVGPDSVVAVRHGRRILLRVVLTSRRNAFGTRTITAALRVPSSAARGDAGTVQVGSDDGGADLVDGSGAVSSSGGGEPASFGQLLRRLQTAPRNDEVPMSLTLFSSEDGTPAAQLRKQAGMVVTGSTQFTIRVR